MDVLVRIVIVIAHEKLSADEIFSRIWPEFFDFSVDLFKEGELFPLRRRAGLCGQDGEPEGQQDRPGCPAPDRIQNVFWLACSGYHGIIPWLSQLWGRKQRGVDFAKKSNNLEEIQKIE